MGMPLQHLPSLSLAACGWRAWLYIPKRGAGSERKEDVLRVHPRCRQQSEQQGDGSVRQRRRDLRQPFLDQLPTLFLCSATIRKTEAPSSGWGASEDGALVSRADRSRPWLCSGGRSVLVFASSTSPSVKA